MFSHLFRSKYFVVFNAIVAGIISLIKFWCGHCCYIEMQLICILILFLSTLQSLFISCNSFFSKFLRVFCIQDFLFLCFYSYYIS